MINEKIGRIKGLTMAIILVAVFVSAAILLAIKIVNDIKKETKGLASEETKIRKGASLRPGTTLPRLKDVGREEYLAEGLIKKEAQEEERPVPEVRLKDFSIEKVLAEEEEGYKQEIIKEEKRRLKTKPSPKEMEELKTKGVIIF